MTTLPITVINFNSSRAADLNKIKEDAFTLGYCLYCAESLGMTTDNDEDGEFMAKVFPLDESMMPDLSDDKKKIAEGKEIALIWNENTHAGKAAAEASKGARCRDNVSKIIEMYKAMGFTGSTWIAINEKLGGKDKETKEDRISYGIYKHEGEEIVNIVLNSDKTGYETILAFEDHTSPFTWETSGNNLIFTYQNEKNNIKKAKILSPSSFVLEESKFVIDPSAIIANYNYAEDGYGGHLTISNFGEAGISLELETVNNENASTCEVKAECNEKSGKLICRAPDNTDADAMIVLQESGEILNVDTTLPVGDYCGNGGNFTGKYKHIK